ncbi:MAG: hypothetical protein D3906_12315, partial [Candidatus Electrothrix sp. AUS1_2]|nr:hypothetical protein [Candidatus Electrothrix sp. AUS1_2]
GMESQRLAAEYLTKAWGVEDAQYVEEVQHMIEEIESIFKDLMKEDEKFVSKEIKDMLKDLEKDFVSFGVMASSTSGRFMPSAAEKMASKIFDKLEEILHKEQKLVEGTISGYFTPVADEKTAGEIFRVITEIVHVKGGIRS